MTAVITHINTRSQIMHTPTFEQRNLVTFALTRSKTYARIKHTHTHQLLMLKFKSNRTCCDMCGALLWRVLLLKVRGWCGAIPHQGYGEMSVSDWLIWLGRLVQVLSVSDVGLRSHFSSSLFKPAWVIQ